MDLALILFKQNIIMAIYMALGFVLYKKKLLSKTGTAEFGKLLISIIMPCMIMRSYYKEVFNRESVTSLGIAILAALVCLLIAIAVSRIAFRKDPIEHFGCSFSNAGFMGIPLIDATLGSWAVFYIASFVAFLNIAQWTYGVYVMTKNKEAISVKKIVTNPVVIGFVVGLALFGLKGLLPSVLGGNYTAIAEASVPVTGMLASIIDAIANMSAPVAMIILGTYLAQLPIREMFRGKQVYLCTVLRLVVIPLLTVAALSVFPEKYNAIKMALAIVAAAPVGSNVAIFAQIHDKDYTQAMKDVCLTTIVCIVTMPLIAGLASMLWQ